MTSRQRPPGREHPFFRNLAERRQRRARPPAVAPESQHRGPQRSGRFRRTAAHYWHHARKSARQAGHRYPSFVQVPGPWRVARLGALFRARQRGTSRAGALVGAWFEWLFTRPKMLLTRSGTARLAVEVFSVVVVLGTLWTFWIENERRAEEREDRAADRVQWREEADQRRLDRINNAWALIAAAKDETTGNIGLVDAIATLRSYGIDDFSGLVLPGAHLQNVKLAGAKLEGATLRMANLVGADLSGTDLLGADLADADLFGADLSGARLAQADLSGAQLLLADLSGAFAVSADLSGAELIGADLSDAKLPTADLSGADLEAADLSGADLRFADLSGADLGDADLSFADMRVFCVASISLSSAAKSRIATRPSSYFALACQWLGLPTVAPTSAAPT